MSRDISIADGGDGRHCEIDADKVIIGFSFDGEVVDPAERALLDFGDEVPHAADNVAHYHQNHYEHKYPLTCGGHLQDFVQGVQELALRVTSSTHLADSE